MSNPEDFILVLCYANWCGHCKNFYHKDKDDKPLSLEEIKNTIKGLSWQQVKAKCSIKATQFEESELKGKVNIKEKQNDGVEVEKINLKDLSSRVKGWPTILILKKDNSGQYVYHETYEGERKEMTQFEEFINKFTQGNSSVETKKEELKGGKRRTKKSSRKGSRKIQDGGKRRSRKAASKKGSKKTSKKIQDGGKRRSRKAASKKGSKKNSKKIQDGGKRRSRKAASKKGSKKGSKKIQDGGKRRTKKSSKKSSRKIQEGGKRRTKKSSKKSRSKKGKKY